MNFLQDQEQPGVEQLMLLREQSEKYGIIHDAQQLQLKYWPRILIPNSKSAETRLDPEHFRAEVHVKTKLLARHVDPGNIQKLMTGIQWLLGETWTVVVYVNGTSVATLDRKVSAEPKYQGTDFEAGKIVPEKPWKFPKTVKPQ